MAGVLAFGEDPMNPLTADDLADLELLAEKASPAPWTEQKREDVLCRVFFCLVDAKGKLVTSIEDMNEADEAFVIAARDALPRLVEALHEARAALEWYADEGNWQDYKTPGGIENPAWNDEGKRARKVLTGRAGRRDE